jgi:cyclopropane fatty-acyl-phospholipid synthase-like methyltransferase
MSDPSGINRESYDAIVADWDAARARLSAAEARILDIVLADVTKGAPVLDLGCGTGRPIAEHLLACGLAVTGVDQSPRMLALARTRLPDATWVEARIEDLVPRGPFAAAVAWDSLFHVPRAHHAGVFGRVRAALTRGGRFALTVGGSDPSGAGCAQPGFTDTMFGQTFFYDSHPPEAATALLVAAGFAIVHAEFLSLPTSGRDKGRYAIVAAAS